MNVLDHKHQGNRDLRDSVIAWLTDNKPLAHTFRDTNIKKDYANLSSSSFSLQTLNTVLCGSNLNYDSFIEEAIRKSEWADALLIG